VDTPAVSVPGSPDPVLRARASKRPCLILALGWALPGVVFGGYGVARDIAIRQILLSPGPTYGNALALPPSLLPALSFAFFLVMVPAVLLLVPLLVLGLVHLSGSPPSSARRRTAWLGVMAAGAAVDAGWIIAGNQQGSPNALAPQLSWSPLIMFLGHLAVGVTMLIVLRSATRPDLPQA
jgi:hypothetical protein